MQGHRFENSGQGEYGQEVKGEEKTSASIMGGIV